MAGQRCARWRWHSHDHSADGPRSNGGVHAGSMVLTELGDGVLHKICNDDGEYNHPWGVQTGGSNFDPHDTCHQAARLHGVHPPPPPPQAPLPRTLPAKGMEARGSRMVLNALALSEDPDWPLGGLVCA